MTVVSIRRSRHGTEAQNSAHTNAAGIEKIAGNKVCSSGRAEIGGSRRPELAQNRERRESNATPGTAGRPINRRAPLEPETGTIGAKAQRREATND
jgi:hypothetical protein